MNTYIPIRIRGDLLQSAGGVRASRRRQRLHCSNLQHGRPDAQGEITGANGEFELKGQDFPLDTVHIHISDIDGPENGAYGKMEPVVQLTQTESGDGHWYNGKFVATNVVIWLEEEERSE